MALKLIVEDYVILIWFYDIMEMKLLRCELWLWLMKLEDGNMLWICRLNIRSFGWIMTLVESLYILYILWIYCRNDMKYFQITLQWSWLMMNMEMLILVWDCLCSFSSHSCIRKLATISCLVAAATSPLYPFLSH